jgi:LuxR family maltose regulon positive regulatory protein
MTASAFCSAICRPRCILIIASRADPPLSLARLRSHGDLTELRVSDLRFTPEEAAAFLNQVMGLEISAADVAALEQRTEGWIAGLQLAALSMQGRDDLPGFIAAFSGDDRYIVDYLLEEVLQRQSDRTSVTFCCKPLFWSA